MKNVWPMKMILASVVFVVTLSAASFAWRDSDERYLITGSSTVAPIMSEIVTILETENPQLKIDVQTGGSTRGVVDTRDGQSSAGMASRELSQEEAHGLAVYRIAYDGIALIVNAKNAVDTLSREQVRQLFTKKIDRWESLGRHSGAVHVVNKAEGRATLDVFLEYFELKNSDIKPDAVIGDNAQGVRLVAANTQAIGYVSISEALAAVERGEPIKTVALDDVLPTLLSIADGSYPLRRELNLLFKGKADAIGEKILAAIRSDKGLATIQNLGFVSTDES